MSSSVAGNCDFTSEKFEMVSKLFGLCSLAHSVRFRYLWRECEECYALVQREPEEKGWKRRRAANAEGWWCSPFFSPLLLCSCSLPCWFDLLFHMPLRFLLLMPPARCFLPLSFLLLTASSRSTLSERSKQRERRNSRKKERGIEKTSLPLRILEGLFRRKGGREGRRKKKPETHLFFPSFPVLSASILSTTPRSRTSARATSASPS